MKFWQGGRDADSHTTHANSRKENAWSMEASPLISSRGSILEWQTAEENEDVWQHSFPAGTVSQSNNRLWLRIILLLIGLTGGSIALILQTQEWTGKALQTTAANVEATHQLVYLAEERQDVELFINHLSGRDPAWTQAMTNLMLLGRLEDRSALGLAGVPTLDSPITVTLSPKLDAATLETQRTFATTLPDGTQSLVSLKQVEMYRRGGEAWLLSPLLPAEWGTTQQYHGQWLTAFFLERDAAVANRLLPDLDAILNSLCNKFSRCVENSSLITLRLATSPGTLLALEEPFAQLKTGKHLFLPAPTLVGIPQDEAGYQALYRAYAFWTVSAAVNQLLDYECCSGAQAYQTLLAEQFHQLGLVPSPIPTIALSQTMRQTRAQIQPEQWLAFACHQPVGLGGVVYQYDWVQGAVERITSGPQPMISPMAGDAGLIINDLGLADGGVEQQVRLWLQGESQIIYQAPADNILNIKADDPQNRLLTIRQISGELPGGESVVGVDMRECSATGCRTFNLAGRPLWSPDRSRTLLLEEVGDRHVYVGNALAQALFPLNGISTSTGTLVWKDDENFYSVSRNATVSALIQRWDITGKHTSLLSLSAESLAGVNSSDNWSRASVGYGMAVSPSDDESILLDVTVINPSYRRYVMEIDLDNGERSVLLDSRNEGVDLVGPAQLSSNGRWLTVWASAPGRQHMLLLYDLERQTITRLQAGNISPHYDWSLDGRWLAYQREDGIQVFSPDTGLHTTLTNTIDCNAPVWVNAYR